MIAVTLAKPSDLALANASGADFIEIRSDLYPEIDLSALLDQSKKPVIFTVKKDNLEALFLINHPNIDYVDLDIDLSDHWTFSDQQKAPGLILSYHDYEKTPSLEEAQKMVDRMKEKKADKFKLAFKVNQFSDLLVIARLQKELGQSAIVIGMGELGKITRLYSKAWLTYACLTEEEAVAPGQIPIDQMKTKQIFGLVGKGIEYSLSPKIYKTAFAHHKLPHDYLLFDVEDFEIFKEVFQFFQMPACSVTQPYKKEALAFADIVSEDAKTIGASNLLVRGRSGLIHAYNSDWVGVQKSLEGKLKDKNVLILGRGGAALACEYACKQSGASFCTMLGRNDLPTERSDYDVLINATPVVDQLLVSPESLKEKVVMDCNYKADSLLMQEARNQEVEVVDGLNMLICQAVKHYDAFCGKELPVHLMNNV